MFISYFTYNDPKILASSSVAVENQKDIDDDINDDIDKNFETWVGKETLKNVSEINFERIMYNISDFEGTQSKDMVRDTWRKLQYSNMSFQILMIIKEINEKFKIYNITDKNIQKNILEKLHVIADNNYWNFFHNNSSRFEDKSESEIILDTVTERIEEYQAELEDYNANMIREFNKRINEDLSKRGT